MAYDKLVPDVNDGITKANADAVNDRIDTMESDIASGASSNPAAVQVLSSSATATNDTKKGSVVFQGFTTAQGAGLNTTIHNSQVEKGDTVLVSVMNQNASTQLPVMSISGVLVDTHELQVLMINNGAGDLGTGDDVTVSFWVLK